MPGRKTLLMISPNVQFPESLLTRSRDYRSEFSPRMNELADEALRTGVVMHVLDIRGLIAGPNAPYIPGSNHILAKKTGGITVQNSNFFVDGIGWANEEMKGYYLLSYVPPAETFKPDARNKYHRIKVKVKRRFSEVHTRDGFYGGIPSAADRFVENKIPLQEAIFSPFLYDDLTVRLASGYTSEPETGYLLRSWMHLDSRDLTFIDEQDGGHAVSLELATITTDINGQIQDSKAGIFEGYIRNEYLDRMKKSGFGFNLDLPVGKPGAYYVRVALKDLASGKIGTAYQFLEIPDLEKKRLSLSSIFVLNHGEERSGFGAIDMEEGEYRSDVFLDQREVRKSPAIRNYIQGEGFDYKIIVYNAESEENHPPELEYQLNLFKDDEEFIIGDIKPVVLGEIDDSFGIPISQTLQIEEKMDPGKYVLQLMVRDKQAKEKHSMATQAIDFEIKKTP